MQLACEALVASFGAARLVCLACMVGWGSGGLRPRLGFHTVPTASRTRALRLAGALCLTRYGAGTIR